MDVDGWGVEAHAGQGHGEGERGGVGTELGIEPTGKKHRTAWNQGDMQRYTIHGGSTNSSVVSGSGHSFVAAAGAGAAAGAASRFGGGAPFRVRMSCDIAAPVITGRLPARARAVDVPGPVGGDECVRA